MISRENKKGTWPQALITLFLPLFGVLFVRWGILEPFVIPSGSMIPTLLVHDHILVNKMAFGWHLPFGKIWLAQWSHPTRNEIVVFKFPQNPEIYYVKRVVAIAGDEVEVKNGELFINDQKILQEPSTASAGLPESGDFSYYLENGHLVRYREGRKEDSEFAKITVPEGQFFVMGDNRDQSYDSREWGFVPEQNLAGRAWAIWLSCDKTLESTPILCDPRTIRWRRLLKGVH